MKAIGWCYVLCVFWQLVGKVRQTKSHKAPIDCHLIKVDNQYVYIPYPKNFKVKIDFLFFLVAYILQARAALESQAEEESVTKLFNEGGSTTKGLVEILKKLNRPDQPLLFYSGGLRVVQSLIQDGKKLISLKS